MKNKEKKSEEKFYLDSERKMSKKKAGRYNEEIHRIEKLKMTERRRKRKRWT